MRSKDYRCIYCGKYIAYRDIPEKVGQAYTPDSEYTTELIEMWHKSCKSKNGLAGIVTGKQYIHL